MADLLFELLCEELPPRDLRRAAEALGASIDRRLTEHGVPAESISVAFTPRRMTVFGTGLPTGSPDREERVKGPRLGVAFGDDGTPSRAAEGFARKHGLTPADLLREGDNVVAVTHTAGRPTAELLATVLPAAVSDTPWKKRMRWGPAETFARPIRGVVALLGAHVVPCEIADLASGRTTTGHPFLAPFPIELADASRDAYVSELRAAHVLVDPAERESAIRAAAGDADPGVDIEPDLLEEVVNLVEWPTALVGRFDEAYLALPPRLLVTVMAHHQRFFPVRDAVGALLPRFVAVLDREVASHDVARPGFQRVLVPRLHDAQFFLSEDRKRTLEERLPDLDGVVYHRKLGTLKEKAHRLAERSHDIAGLLGLSGEQCEHARRAGLLAKCDLVTLMVGEFPELQGHVGSVYAAADGEPAAVCEAIDRHYDHDFAEGDVPGGPALSVLLGECLDTLASFGTKVGLPTGSADPFGVRRAALTFLAACEAYAPELPLEAALDRAGADDGVREYLRKRLVRRLRDRGVPPDHVEAVTAYSTLGALLRRLADLDALASAPGYERLLEVAERCRNITRKSDAPDVAVRDDLLVEDAERALHAVWAPLGASLPPAPEPLSREDALRLAAEIAEPLHAFFEKVFVNAEDAALRANRHALLREIDAALLRFADLCRIVRHG